MNTPIRRFAELYRDADPLRLHMPGHGGLTDGGLGCEALDITEVQGADDLSCPDGVILESENNTSALYGSRHTFYSAGGSSQCVKAMLYLAYTHRPEGAGRRIIAARNAHKSFLHGCALLGLEPDWLLPGSESPLCSCPVGPEALSGLLGSGEKPCAVYITSPDYLGGTQDTAALAGVCHAHGVPLLVDNAHGAYLKFLSPSRHPLDLGADMCCDSAHKTLPVLTGGAYLHVARGAMAPYEASARQALAVFGSSSPSYLILQSLDLCAAWLDGEGPELIRQTARRAAQLARGLGLPKPAGDPLKLAIPSSDYGLTGAGLARCLRASGIEPEYADPDWLVLMFSPLLGPEAFERILGAMPQRRPVPRRPLTLPPPGRMALTPREALLSPRERVRAAEAVGRVMATAAVTCPPAVPIAVMGELISARQAELMAAYGIEYVDVVR